MCWPGPAPRQVRAPGPARTSVPFLSFPAWLSSRAALLPTNEEGTVGVEGPGGLDCSWTNSTVVRPTHSWLVRLDSEGLPAGCRHTSAPLQALQRPPPGETRTRGAPNATDT